MVTLVWKGEGGGGGGLLMRCTEILIPPSGAGVMYCPCTGGAGDVSGGHGLQTVMTDSRSRCRCQKSPPANTLRGRAAACRLLSDGAGPVLQGGQGCAYPRWEG